MVWCRVHSFGLEFLLFLDLLIYWCTICQYLHTATYNPFVISLKVIYLVRLILSKANHGPDQVSDGRYGCEQNSDCTKETHGQTGQCCRALVGGKMLDWMRIPEGMLRNLHNKGGESKD